MKQKWVALLLVMAYVLGLKRTTNRSFRIRLLFEFAHHKGLKTADEIWLNTLFIQIRHKDKIQSVMKDKRPLTDEEREALRALLTLILSRKFVCEKTYEQDVELSHQVTYRFMKTQA
jgi:hypothetical protein